MNIFLTYIDNFKKMKYQAAQQNLKGKNSDTIFVHCIGADPKRVHRNCDFLKII